MYISECRVSENTLIIAVNSESSFDGLKNEIEEKIEEILSMYKNNSCEEISIENGKFSPEELYMLKDIIYKRLKGSSEAEKLFSRFKEFARPYDENETQKLFEKILSPEKQKKKPSAKKEISDYKYPNKNYADFKTGSVRSGQIIESAGSVIILGDVNPGAEIRAGESIIVLGKLKGLVIAGMNGNTQSYVAAAEFNPEQLIITNIVADFKKPSPVRKFMNRQKQILPQYAHIEGEQIFIDPLV